MAIRNNSGGLVYSTDGGNRCPVCRRATGQCTCREKNAIPAPGGVVRVFRESKGRAGKSVTVIKGLALNPTALAQLGRQLKTACGSGGTVKDGMIEVQGEHCDRVIELLRSQGCNAKRAGG